jgi:hypothetical protein
VAEHEQPHPALADEAVRLFGALQDWARETFPPGPDAHPAAPCQWCPLCQFVAVLRGERPEVTEQVAEVGTALASALRTLVEAASRPTPHAEPRPDRVQRIDLSEPPE